MPTTPVYGLRYPASTDSADVPRDVGNLASDVETALGPKDPPAGIIAGEASVWDGSTWQRSSVTKLTGYADKTVSAAQIFAGSLSTGPASGTFSGSQVNGVYIGTNGQINCFNAAGFVALNIGLTADTVARFSLNYVGTMTWGPGGAGAQDTNLYRSAANTLKTDDAFVAAGFTSTAASGLSGVSAAGNSFVWNYLAAGQAQPAFRIYGDGRHDWGPGGSTVADITQTRVVNAPTGTGSFLELTNGDGFGYGTGTGGAATTSAGLPSATVTINRPTGKITGGAAVPATNLQYYTVTNSVVGVDDVIVLSLVNGGSPTYQHAYFVSNIAAGSFVISFYNGNSAASLAPVFTFAVIKGAVA